MRLPTVALAVVLTLAGVACIATSLTEGDRPVTHRYHPRDAEADGACAVFILMFLFLAAAIFLPV